jgi:hypothetical protein
MLVDHKSQPMVPLWALVNYHLKNCDKCLLVEAFRVARANRDGMWL